MRDCRGTPLIWDDSEVDIGTLDGRQVCSCMCGVDAEALCWAPLATQ